MKSRPSASVLKSAVWNSLAGVLTLLSFPAVTYADHPGLSLDPDPPKECETLTVHWDTDRPAAILIGDQGQQPAQTLFQTIVNVPTGSVEWVVSATSGALLEFVFAELSGLGIEMHADRTVQPGTPTCFSSRDPSSSLSGPLVSILRGQSSDGSASTQTSDTRIVAPTGSQSFTARSSSQPTASSSTASSSLPQSTSPTASPDPTTSPPFVVALTPSLSSPTPTPLPTSASQSRLHAGAVAGIVAGVGAGVICLASVSFSYIKRRRSRASTARVNPFIARRQSRLYWSSHTDASSSDADRDDDRSESEMYDEVAPARANSSLVVTGASPVASRPPYGVAHLSHPRQESTDRLVKYEELLRELRSRAVTTSPSGGVSTRTADTAVEVPISSGRWIGHRRGPQYETDGGVRLAGGRPGEPVAADEYDEHSASDSLRLILPPPYSPHFRGETGR